MTTTTFHVTTKVSTHFNLAAAYKKTLVIQRRYALKKAKAQKAFEATLNNFEPEDLPLEDWLPLRDYDEVW